MLLHTSEVNEVFYRVDAPRFVYPLTSCKTFGSLPVLGDYK